MNRVGLIEAAGCSPVYRKILGESQSEVLVWSPEDGSTGGEDGARQVDLEELAQASLLIFNAPLIQARPLARQLGDVITGRHVVVHTVRGVEPGTGKAISEILQEETPTQRFGFMTGPMAMKDQTADRPGAVVCASLFPEVHDLVEEAMVAPNFRVYRSQDLIGAEISAAYGRVMAMISGLGEGLKVGESLQALLFARGLAEISRFVVFREGFERTTFGLAGLGNLHLDTAGEGSPDYQIGRYVAGKNQVAGEGVVAEYGEKGRELLAILDAFYKAASRAELDTPLLAGIEAILHQGVAASEVIEGLMRLPALYE